LSIALATSEKAQAVYQLVSGLQQYFAEALQSNIDLPMQCNRADWLRNEGLFGGGNRLECESSFFNSGSINVSQVQYENVEDKKLKSATALSTIIHPENPHCPSIHIHISYTEMKSGEGYWRMMMDLNPSLSFEKTDEFKKIISNSIPQSLRFGYEMGDQYFHIPVLKRHRGVCHFYLEQYNGKSFQDDLLLARTLTENVMKYYSETIAKFNKSSQPLEEDKALQLDYHTLYFFQVCTLDKGTTAGLLVHNENDVGILGSLPKRVNKSLLETWVSKMPEPQEGLLKNLITALGEDTQPFIDKKVKNKLAQAIRDHYRKYPQAMSLQASCDNSPSKSIHR
jgi:coproporphyrinogen III oxidase